MGSKRTTVSIPRFDSLRTVATRALNGGALGDRSWSISGVPSIGVAISLGLYRAKPGNSRRNDESPLVVMKKETP